MLYETYVSRYTRGGFLTGDLVKFKKGFENSESFKKLEEFINDMDDYFNKNIKGRESKTKVG